MTRKNSVTILALILFLTLFLTGCSRDRTLSEKDVLSVSDWSSMSAIEEVDMQSSASSEANDLMPIPDFGYQEVYEGSLTTEDFLDEWIGKFNFIYTSDMGHSVIPDPEGVMPLPKAITMSLTIYKEDNKYFANFSMDGWQTDYQAKATAHGNSEVVNIFYDSCIRGCEIFFLDKQGKSTLQSGDLLFTLKQTDAGLETEVGDVLKTSSARFIVFKKVDPSEE